MEKTKRILVSAGNGLGQVASIGCKIVAIAIGLGFGCMIGADIIDRKQRKIKFNK